MPLTRTRAGHLRNAAATARPAIAGGDREELSAFDVLAMQNFTTVSGLTVELTDDTTQTMQSDDDAFTLAEDKTGYGTTQEQTFTLTELKDASGNAPFIQGLKRSLPYSLCIGEGRDRNIHDPYSGSSFEFINRFYIKGQAQDDDSNPSDGDVGNANTMSITCAYNGRDYSRIRQCDLVSPSTDAITHPVVGVGYIEQRSLGGGIGRKWIAIESGTTSQKPKIHIRDGMGQWVTPVEFGADADVCAPIAVVGSYVITGQDDKTYSINTDDTSSVNTVTHNLLDATNTEVQKVYALSATEIFVIAGAVANTGVGKVIKMTTPFAQGQAVAGTDLDAGSATGSIWRDIHSRGNQVAIVGRAGTDTSSTYEAAMKVSNNRGVSWKDVAVPSGAGTDITAVHVYHKDTFYIGTATGKIYWTHDGGKTWNTELTVTGATPTYISQITFVEPKGASLTRPGGREGYIFGLEGASTKTLFVARTLDSGNRFVSGTGFSNLLSTSKFGKAHANTKWSQIAISDSQTLIAGGTQGATAGSEILVLSELE